MFSSCKVRSFCLALHAFSAVQCCIPMPMCPIKYRGDFTGYIGMRMQHSAAEGLQAKHSVYWIVRIVLEQGRAW